MTTRGMLIGGRYRLEQPIGRGRCGFVWLVHDISLQRTVTAKPLSLRRDHAAGSHDSGEPTPEVALQETERARQFRHPCVVTVYDAVHESDHMWLITEYVPAQTMSEFLTSHGRLTPTETSSLGAQLAGALHAAHGHGLLHRAIEPANVLLADDGGVQLTDFVVGAPHPDSPYRAPEFANGTAVTGAADVYSLGATLHRAIVGAPPQEQEAVRVAPVDDLPAHANESDVAHELRGIVLSMLVHDPALRPTMAETESGLSALARGDSPTPSPTTNTGINVSHRHEIEAPNSVTVRAAASPVQEDRRAAAPGAAAAPRQRTGKRARVVAVLVLALLLSALCGLLVAWLLDT